MDDPRDRPAEVLVVEFVFVPLSAAKPEAWQRAHPGAFSVPARMVWREVRDADATKG